MASICKVISIPKHTQRVKLSLTRLLFLWVSISKVKDFLCDLLYFNQFVFDLISIRIMLIMGLWD